MLVYEKKVDGVRHLFGDYESTVPANTDQQLIYKDSDGDVLTPVAGDTYKDDGHGGIYRISDGKPVNVIMKDKDSVDHVIIGNVVAKVLKSIKVKTNPTKTTYTTAETLDTTGLTIEATYADGDKAVLSTGFTTDPAHGAALTEAGETTVTVSYTLGEVTKTTSFKVTVSAPVVEDEEEPEEE